MSAAKEEVLPWLGQTPADWKIKPLYALGLEVRALNRGLVEDNLLSLSYGEIKRKDIEANFGLLPESFETYQVVEAGDVVFRFTDLQNDQKSLRSALVKQRGIITNAYVGFRPKGIDSRYFNYLMRAYDLAGVFYSMGSGLRQSLNYSDVRRLPVVVPPGDEQRRIADFLDSQTAKIDALIAKQEQLVASLNERLHAEISECVMRGLDADVDLKDSGLSWMGQIVSTWTVSRIGRHYDLMLGKMLNEQSKTEGVTLPYVRAGNIQEDGIDFQNIKTMSFSSSEVRSYQILPGDVLVVEGGSIGRSIYLAEGLPQWGYQNHVIRLRARENQFSGFVDFYIKHLRAIGHFDRLSAFATIPNLSADKLSKIEMPVPPLSQQVAIFEHLSGETRRVKELQGKAVAAIDLLYERRQALISAAVTGKLEVGV